MLNYMNLMPPVTSHSPIWATPYQYIEILRQNLPEALDWGTRHQTLDPCGNLVLVLTWYIGERKRDKTKESIQVDKLRYGFIPLVRYTVCCWVLNQSQQANGLNRTPKNLLSYSMTSNESKLKQNYKTFHGACEWCWEKDRCMKIDLISVMCLITPVSILVGCMRELRHWWDTIISLYVVLSTFKYFTTLTLTVRELGLPHC